MGGEAGIGVSDRREQAGTCHLSTHPQGHIEESSLLPSTFLSLFPPLLCLG